MTRSIINHVTDENEMVKDTAAWALGRIVSAHQDLVPGLLKEVSLCCGLCVGVCLLVFTNARGPNDAPSTFLCHSHMCVALSSYWLLWFQQ